MALQDSKRNKDTGTAIERYIKSFKHANLAASLESSLFS